MTRFIVSAGRLFDPRWPESIGTPKQLVRVGDERLIERTVRQFEAHGEVIVAYGGEPFPIEAAQVAAEPLGLGDIDGILNARLHWSRLDRTVVVMGDVWFTDDAVETIAEPRVGWCLYGRPGFSAVTGKGDEQFAVGFWPDEHDAVYRAAAAGARLVTERRIRWCRFPQWFHLMHGLTNPILIDREPDVALGHFTVIEDETDDIDYPADYEALRSRVRQPVGVR